MNDLERLLAGCLRWAGGKEDADVDGLLIVADWLEEHGRTADAEAVRHIHGRDLTLDAGHSGDEMGWHRVDSGWGMVLTPQWASGRSSLHSLYANVEKVDRRGVIRLSTMDPDASVALVYARSVGSSDINHRRRTRLPVIDAAIRRIAPVLKLHACLIILGYTMHRLATALAAA